MPYLKNCKICKKIVNIKFRCWFKKRKFCSHQCYSVWRSQTIRGKKHPSWIISNVYKNSTIHMWLRRTFGKAIKCENFECKKKSKNFQWSLKKQKKYIKQRNNFWMLCRSCHAKYDIKPDTIEKFRKKMVGRIPWNKGIKAKDDIRIARFVQAGHLAIRNKNFITTP